MLTGVQLYPNTVRGLTNLLSCSRHWLSSLDSGKSTDVIYIDFAKAFDSVSHSKLLHKLKSYNNLSKLFDWISAWLTGRTQSVKIHNFFSTLKSVLSGILQGSVLGPLLFLLFINDLCDSISPDVHLTFFADDLKLSLTTFPFLLSFCLIMSIHRFFKTPWTIYSRGLNCGSSPFLYLNVLFFLFPILNFLNLASILLAL